MMERGNFLTTTVHLYIRNASLHTLVHKYKGLELRHSESLASRVEVISTHIPNLGIILR
jgi:hypothetical protein